MKSEFIFRNSTRLPIAVLAAHLLASCGAEPIEARVVGFDSRVEASVYIDDWKPGSSRYKPQSDREGDYRDVTEAVIGTECVQVENDIFGFDFDDMGCFLEPEANEGFHWVERDIEGYTYLERTPILQRECAPPDRTREFPPPTPAEDVECAQSQAFGEYVISDNVFIIYLEMPEGDKLHTQKIDPDYWATLRVGDQVNAELRRGNNITVITPTE